MSSSMPARALLDEGLVLQKAGMLDRAIAKYTEAMEAAGEPAIIAEALRRQSHAYRMRCDWDRAISAARQSADLARTSGLNDLVAEAMNAEGAVHQSVGELTEASRLFEEILTTTADPRIRGVALQNLAAVRAMDGDLSAAAVHFRAAYDCFSNAGYAWGQAHILNNLGRLALDGGNMAEAEESLHRAIDAAMRVEDLDLLAIARLNLAEVLMRLGSHDKAEDAASAALNHFGGSGNHWRSIECLRILGDLNVATGSLDAAHRFYSSALLAAEQIGAKAEQAQLRERLATLR
jgi:tetratricopeptide (TPR) repeat protein